MSNWVQASAEEAALFRQKASADTGFYARHVAEFDYDETEGDDGFPVKGNRPFGGIRSTGSHYESTAFLDKPGGRKLMLEPRGSYKSTKLETYCCRHVSRDRDTTILYMMATEEMAKTKVRDMGRILLSDRSINTFGPMKGKKWSDSQIFVSGRSHNVAENVANIKAVGRDSDFTGSHYRIIILDDIVNWDNVRNSDQLEKTLDVFKMVIPLLDPGGILIVVGTRYVEQDLYGHIIRNMPSFDILNQGCGMEVKREESGKWVLEGEPRYEHLTKEHLQNVFETMCLEGNPADFVSQYQNSIMSSAEQLFSRQQFRVMRRYETWLDDCRAYILTDTATSTSEKACYSVAALILLDFRDNAYLVDLRVGRMKPWEFVGEFIDLIEKWSPRFMIHGATFEKIGLNDTYQAMITEELRRRGRSIRLVGISRGTADAKKERRIARLQGRFSTGRFWVVDDPSIRTFTDLGQNFPLFDPEGYRDEDNMPWPDGELVKEFVFFPRYGRNDIADAIADIDAVDAKGKRFCPPAPRTVDSEARHRQLQGVSSPIAPVHMDINGINRVIDAAEGAHMNASGGKDWWDLAYQATQRSISSRAK